MGKSHASAKVAIAGVIIVIALLGGSAVLQVEGVSNPIGKFILQRPPAASSLILTGAVYNADGSVNTTTGASSSPLNPLSVTAGPTGGAGGGGSCASTTSTPVGQGAGWGIAVKPVYNGTATAMTISGSYTLMLDGVSTGVTKTFTYSQIIPSETSVTIKPLSEDIDAAQIVSTAAGKTGQQQVSISPTVTITITYANGLVVTLTGTGSGNEPVNITQSGTTYCVTSLGVSATGGTFST